jgi:hypothetical protein
MDGHRHDQVTDAALDREIESMLAVDPSPEFAARVRARVGEGPVPVQWWRHWKPGVAAAVAVIAAFVMWPDRVQREEAPVPARLAIERTEPSVPVAPSSPAEAQVARPERSEPVRRRGAPRAAETAPAMAAVPVVSEDDARAFDAFLAVVRDRNIRLVFDEETPASALTTSTIAIAPIAIEPLPAISEGGVE